MRRAALKTKRTIAVFTLALASCRSPIQSPTNTPQVISLRIITTSSTAPLLQELTTAYSNDHALASFSTQNENTLTLQQIIENTSSTPSYAITNYLPPSTNIWAAPIGYDAIAVIAHPDVEISSLSANDLRSIFMGITINWSVFIESNMDIVVVTRESTSTTQHVFRNQVLGQRTITPAARLATTESSMLSIVAETPGAIGFVSLASLTDDSGIYIIPITTQEGDTPILPTIETVTNETYPLRTPLLIVGSQPPTSDDIYYEFIVWLQNEGQSIIGQHYAPLQNQK